MKIDVRAVNFQMSESLDDHAQRRIQAALDRFEPRIGWVHLRLRDDHGTRHGTTIHCCIEAAIQGRGNVVVEQEAPNLWAAIDQAAGRMKRTVRRCINKERDSQSRTRLAG